MNQIGLYAKAVAAAVTLALTTAVAGLSDGSMTPQEWVAVAIAFLGGAGAVWAVPSTPAWLGTYGKSAVAGLLGGGGALFQALAEGGVSTAEWLTIIMAILAGSGLVAITPNAGSSEFPVDPEAEEVQEPEDGWGDNDHDLEMPDGFDDGSGSSTPASPDNNGVTPEHSSGGLS